MVRKFSITLIFEKVMQVNRAIEAPFARLTQMKSSPAATFVLTKSLFLALIIMSAPAFADTLIVGSVYFDSEQTFSEVINLSSQHDNEGIAELIKNGHISSQTREDQDIVVLSSASTPDSLIEFRFLNGPTTFWALAKNVTNLPKSLPTQTPTPAPFSTPKPLATPTPESAPLPTETLTPSSKQHNRQRGNNARFADDNDKRIRHQVDGKWKWHPATWSAVALPVHTANLGVSPGRPATVPASSPRPTPTPLIMNEGTDLYNSDRTQPFKDYRKPAGQQP
jgi:hypothetical protein